MIDMADNEVRMVVVNGVRYRPEDAPKDTKQQQSEEQPAENKMRTTRTAKRK